MNISELEYQIEKLYKENAAMVYNVALRITAQPYLAEETVQEVFVKIYKNLEKFKQFSEIKTWIYRITVNTALNILKSQNSKRRLTESIDSEMEETIQDPNDNMDRRTDIISTEEQVQKMLNSLNPKYRSCIVLREIEGLSYEEIAKVLDTNINSVRTNIKRGREKLIQLFKKEGNNHEMR